MNVLLMNVQRFAASVSIGVRFWKWLAAGQSWRFFFLLFLVFVAGGSSFSLPAYAQSVSPTAPCTPNTSTTPAGWRIVSASPDCSDLNNWGGYTPWDNAPMPSLPTGDSTFSSMVHWGGVGSAGGFREAIATKIEGLVPGRNYKIPFYLAPWPIYGDSRQYVGCRQFWITYGSYWDWYNSVATEQQRIVSIPEGEWSLHFLDFTADSTTQDIIIEPTDDRDCMMNFAMGVYPLDVIKTASVDRSVVGEDVTFTFAVKNTGVEPMTNVRIKEDYLERSDGTPLTLTTGPTFVSNSGASPAGSLQPGETATFTATYTLTQPDVNDGRLSNQAVGAGVLPGGEEITVYSKATAEGDQAPTIVNLPKTPEIDLVKKGVYQDTNANQLLDVGDRIIYSFEVENTGNVVLTDVTVTDPLGTVAGGPLATLAPLVKDTTTFSLVYELTQADINNGQVINTALVEGRDPDDETVSDTDSLTTSLGSKQSIKLEKYGSHVDFNNNMIVDVGDYIEYSFIVTNTGDVDLTNVTLSDDIATSVTGGPISLLPPHSSDSTTFSARYDLTQSDIDDGDVTNTATVTAMAPDGASVTDSASTTTHEDGTSKIVLEKTGVYVDANGNNRTDVGDRIQYNFTVRNAGSLTLSAITVSDVLFSVSGGTLSTLAVGATDSTTFSGIYTLTQADLDAGAVVNNATANAEDTHGHPVSDIAEVTVMLDADESVSLTKAGAWVDVNNNGIADLGDRIDYTFVVRNTGEVTLSQISVSDPLTNATLTLAGTLAPDEENTTPLTTSYDLTQADLDRGSVLNTATVAAKAPDGDDLSDTASTTVSLPEAASIMIEKSVEFEDAGTIGVMEPGDRLNYSFTITNTGNVTLSNITVTDPTAVLSGASVPDLAPGASDDTTITGYHILTQTDIDSGTVLNTAAVEGTSPGDKKAEDTSTASYQITQQGGIQLEKVGVYEDTNGNGIADPLDHIRYTFEVTNTGNITLRDIKISDPLVSPSEQTVDELAPGDSDSSVSVLYQLTQADIDRGSVDNSAIVTVLVGQDPPLESESSTTVPLAQVGAIELTKTFVSAEDRNGNGVTDMGDAFIYGFTVENTGNVSLANVIVTDPIAEISGGPIASLAPGGSDSATFTAVYMLQQADLDAGHVLNEAQVVARDPSGQQVTDTSSVDAPIASAPDARLVKSAELVDSNGNGFADAGDHIKYGFRVENTGNVTLSDLTIDDDKVAVEGGPLSTLAVGAVDTTTFSADYEITQADVDAGEVRNIATLHATAPDGSPLEVVSETDQGGGETIVPLERKPAVELVLTGEIIDSNGNGYPDAGETVDYSFAVTNAGNTTLNEVTITTVVIVLPGGGEISIPVTGGPVDGLLPNVTDENTFSATYTLTQEDIDRGVLNAKATVTALDPDEEEVSASSDNELPLPQLASLALAKTGEYRGVGGLRAQPGETLHYEFVVKNDGNVTVENAVPSDPGPRFGGVPGSGSLSAFTPASATLAPGDEVTFSADYVITESDIGNARSHEDGAVNTAFAQGVVQGGRLVVSPEAEAKVPLPGVFIGKSTPLREVRRGDRVPYQLRVAAYALGTATTMNVIDLLPPGFTYQTGSSSFSYGGVTPKVEGRRLVFENVELLPGEPLTIDLTLLVTSSVKPGEYVNQAWVEDLSGGALTGIATAAVEVIFEPVFDCSDITGLVFNDRNRNGYPDAGEEGIAGARVATAKGLLVTTGPKGKFHVACADLPDQRIGTNYIMKLDQRSLPSGYRVTTENPRVVRLTAGKVTNVLFGTTIGRVVRLDVSDAAFAPDGVELQEAWQVQVSQLISLLEGEPSILRLVYQNSDASGRLAARRMRALRRHIAGEWRKVGGRYRLEMETRTINNTR